MLPSRLKKTLVVLIHHLHLASMPVVLFAVFLLRLACEIGGFGEHRRNVGPQLSRKPPAAVGAELHHLKRERLFERYEGVVEAVALALIGTDCLQNSLQD